MHFYAIDTRRIAANIVRIFREFRRTRGEEHPVIGKRHHLHANQSLHQRANVFGIFLRYQHMIVLAVVKKNGAIDFRKTGLIKDQA